MRGDALQTFKNFNGSTRENLGEILAVFRRKYVKPQSMATAKHKFQKLVFNPANQSLVDFLELQRLAKDAFGIAAHAIIERFIFATPEKIKKSGPIGKWHIWADCYKPGRRIRAKWFGSPRWATNKNCEPQYCKGKYWQNKTNVSLL